MALKIEFSASFRDSETTLKVLNELNKEMHALSESAQGVGGSAAKAFEEMKRQIGEFEKSTSAVKGLKDLNKELAELAGMQSGMQNFGRSFSELGKAMNQGLGMATDQLVSNFKQKLEGLKVEADDTAKKLQDSLGKLDDTLLTKQQRKQHEGEAKQYSVTLAKQQEDIKIAEQNLMMNQPRGMLAGGSIASTLTNIGTYGAAAGIASQGVLRFGEGIHEASMSGVRANISNRYLQMQAGEQAAAGDPTLALMQQMGVGEEAGYQGSALNYFDKARGFLGGMGVIGGLATAGVAGASLMTGGLALAPGLALLSGLGVAGGSLASYRSGDEAVASRQQELRGFDMQTYSKIWGPGQQRYQSIYDSQKDMLMNQGDTKTLSTLEALNGAGISDRRALPVMDQMDLYGMPLGGEYKQSTFKHYDEKTGQYITDRSKYASVDKTQIYKIQQDLGLGQGAMTELIRQGGSDNTVKSLDLALGSSDLTNRRAMSSLAESYAQITGKSATGFAESSGAYSTVNAAVQAIKGGNSNISDIDAATAAGQVGSKVQSMYNNPVSLLGSAIDNNMIQMGVSDPTARLAIRREMEAGNFDRANRLIAGITKRSPEDVQKEIQGTRTRVAENMKSVLQSDPNTEAAFSKEGMSVAGTLFGADAKGAQLGLDKAMFGAIEGKGVITGKAATDGKQLTAGEVIDSAQAVKGGTELQVIRETTEKLGQNISNVIGESFRKLGDQILKDAQTANAKTESKRAEMKSNKVTPRSSQDDYANQRTGSY
jgi:hypothetical protein